MMHVTGGATDVTTYFALRLAADGTEATSLTITNFDLQYVRSGVAPVAKVDATALAATDSAHADNKAIEIDPTDQPGLYRVDWPDAAFAAGVSEVILTVKCATCFTEHLRVMIDPPVNVEKWNNTAVPSENTAGYPIVTIKNGSGSGEINTLNGRAEANVAMWGSSTTPVTNFETVFATDFAANYNTTLDKWRVDATHIKSVDALLQIQAEAEEALQTYHLDHLVASADPGGVVANSSFLAKLVSKSATPAFSSFDNTTDSLEAVRDNMGTAQTGDVYAIVNSGTHGNAALNTDLDTLLARLTSARAGYLDNINNANLANVPAFPSNFAALGINASGHISRVTLTDTTTTNTDMLTQANVRTAVGLASANLDTQLGDLPTALENADALLVRNVSNVESSAGEHTICTVVLAMMESSVSGTTWTIKRSNGTTTHATKTVTVDASADPITGVS